MLRTIPRTNFVGMCSLFCTRNDSW